MIKGFHSGWHRYAWSFFSKFPKRKGLEVIVQGYKHKADINLDLTQYSETSNFGYCKSDFIINLICLSDVDEMRKSQAFKLNVTPVENIVKWIKSRCTIEINTNFYRSCLRWKWVKF